MGYPRSSSRSGRPWLEYGLTSDGDDWRSIVLPWVAMKHHLSTLISTMISHDESGGSRYFCWFQLRTCTYIRIFSGDPLWHLAIFSETLPICGSCSSPANIIHIIDHQLTTINHQLTIISHHLTTISHQLTTHINHQLTTNINHQLPPNPRWLSRRKHHLLDQRSEVSSVDWAGLWLHHG